MSQQQLALQAGVSAATIRKLERGQVAHYRRQTLAAVSVALGWPPDALDRIHEGDAPASVEASRPAGPTVTTGDSVARIAQLAARLPPREQRAVELLVEALADGEDNQNGT